MQGSLDLYSHCTSIEWSSLTYSQLTTESIQVALRASVTALTIIRPALVATGSAWVSIGHDLYMTLYYLYEGRELEALSSTLSFFITSLQLATRVYGTTPMMALSLTIKASRYLIQAYREYQNDEDSFLHYIESASHLVLALVTASAAYRHFTPLTKSPRNTLVVNGAPRRKSMAGIRIDKPTIAIPRYSDQPGQYAELLTSRLTEQGATIYDCPRQYENQSELEYEVMRTLEHYPPSSTQSRAQYLFSHAEKGGHVEKILKSATDTLKHSDSLALPGGPDVAKVFYQPYNRSDNRKGINQSTVELAYIFAAEKLNKCIFGVCRGAQLINVYYGGTLKKTSFGMGYHIFETAEKLSNKARDFFAPFLTSSSPVCFSAHHHAADQIGKSLEVVFRYKNIPKALIHKNGQVIGTQFHPEHNFKAAKKRTLAYQVTLKILRKKLQSGFFRAIGLPKKKMKILTSSFDTKVLSSARKHDLECQLGLLQNFIALTLRLR